MRGMILGAGLGTRLRPLTEKTAKPALPVMNIPLIIYAVEVLKQAGIREIIINLHHAPDSIRKILGSGRKFKVKIEYSYESEILGTGGGIKKAEHFFKDESFVVINGDIISGIDLKNAIAFHKEKDAIATMILREDRQVEKYGIIGIDENNRICRFIDLVQPKTKSGFIRNLMFTGIHIFNPQVFEYLPPEIETCVNRYAYPRMIENNEGVFGFITDDFWSDLGTPLSYFETNFRLLQNPALIPFFDPLESYFHRPKREVDRTIRLGKDVVLKEGATLIDPVVIGDGTTIGKGSVIGPNAIIGANCHVESANQIEESILWNGAKTSPNMNLKRQILTPLHHLQIASDGKATTLPS